MPLTKMKRLAFEWCQKQLKSDLETLAQYHGSCKLTGANGSSPAPLQPEIEDLEFRIAGLRHVIKGTKDRNF